MKTHYYISANYNDLEELLEDLAEILKATKSLHELYDDVRYVFEDSKCAIRFGFGDEES